MAIADQLEPGLHLAFCTSNPEGARRDLVPIATEIRAELESNAKVI
ncbi:hypothetical protein BN2476_990051 [Paraburkholderia piptadeniae]|uniref:Uncharacterized protein n=1 Tax=Paraburkholderia piptadeniae TaxID=1701573 RepID=A0A1N7SUB9_9BURK|nr:hypothetical protein BN2476_990051 [Paraburkholderia piptadeniae]